VTQPGVRGYNSRGMFYGTNNSAAHLVLLVLGSVPLWADVCEGLPSGPGDMSKYLDRPMTSVFRMSVKSGGPVFRITVRPLLYSYRNESVHAGDIEIARCQDGKRIQTLQIQAWQPINFGATFVAQDINFDSYNDISVLSEFAAKYGSRFYWVYDPRSESFTENALTRQLSENCLGRDWHGGCWKADTIEFNSSKREIKVHYLIGVGECGSPVDRYRVQNGRLVVVHKEVLEMNTQKCTITVSDLTGDKLRVTVHTFDNKGQPLRSPGR
jgi:hypothetical protein